ncbi:MAG: diadenylate cyclase CdaA [Acidobacteriota bacterium]|nr:diadenylate cyclase CdaA [Acidobacteriota bacterium]
MSLGQNVIRFAELLTWRDAVDILVVAVVIYNLLLLIRGTRAMQMLLGIIFVGLLYYAARLTDLVTLQTLLENLLLVLPFAIIILFQQEMRRALANFGRNPLLGLARQQQAVSAFGDIVLTATTLSARRIGALIVLERLQGLRTYIENGVKLDAALSYDLLINIFVPDTPLHDGAVIVQDDRIAAAACFLPLTPNTTLSKDLGTRHRAALGISEETDAVAVVVSEETGAISLSCDGELIPNLDGKSLRNYLYKYLITDLYPQGPQGLEGPQGSQGSQGGAPRTGRRTAA